MLPDPVDDISARHYKARIKGSYMECPIVIGPSVDVCCLLYKSDLFWYRIKRFQINGNLVIEYWPII